RPCDPLYSSQAASTTELVMTKATFLERFTRRRPAAPRASTQKRGRNDEADPENHGRAKNSSSHGVLLADLLFQVYFDAEIKQLEPHDGQHDADQAKHRRGQGRAAQSVRMPGRPFRRSGGRRRQEEGEKTRDPREGKVSYVHGPDF